jgi:hypothetical protein
VGVAATFTTGIGGGPAIIPILTVAVIVMVKADRLIAVSGLMIGFGGSWLSLLALQLTSGTLESGIEWVAVAVGIVPLAVGSMLVIPTVVRALRRRPWAS